MRICGQQAYGQRSLNTPDEFELRKNTASYTYRTPGTYDVNFGHGLEIRMLRPDRQSGGRLVPGQSGEYVDYTSMDWDHQITGLEFTVREGVEGGRGVEGMDGSKGAEDWVRIEVRKIGLRAKVRHFVGGLWGKTSAWMNWTKASFIATVAAAILAIALTVSC